MFRSNKKKKKEKENEKKECGEGRRRAKQIIDWSFINW